MPDKIDTEERNFFGSLRFMGERFKSGNLPVDLLENVKAYQQVLFALAENIWRERNPDGKRLPHGFRKNLSLSFSHVEEGSARAVLKSDSSVQIGFLSDEFSINYMALAQTEFLDLSRAANENRSIPGIASLARKPLLKLISNLRDGEILEIGSLTGKDQRNPSVRYSEKTMKALSEAAIDSRIKSIEGIGMVRSLLDNSEEIEILTAHGVFRLAVPSEQLRDDRYPIAAFVKFKIEANVLGNGHVQKVIETKYIECLSKNSEHIRFLERLDIINNLSPGWKDGHGKEIGSKAARYCFDLSGFICDLYSDISIFPELDGSIRIEFDAGDLEVAVICKDDYVHLEVFDDSDADPIGKTFFGLSPKLLSDFADLKGIGN